MVVASDPQLPPAVANGRRRWVRTPLAALGIALASICAALFLLLFLLEWLGWSANPYFGLVLFIVLPLGFALGLLLIPIGNLWYRRRPTEAWPRVDFNNPRHQRVVFLGLLLTCVNVVILATGAYGAIHYMETVGFCGQVCHTVMEPYYKAYQDAPHSRVACVNCHVGSGAEALVRSKLNGTRQLFLITTGRYARPVPSPVRTLRPARETCETCHWSEKMHGDKMRVVREFGNDETNAETVTTLRVHVGGGSARLGIGTGIHWHMNVSNEVEYIATDPQRQVIPWIRLRKADGTVREYRTADVSDEVLAKGERRRMDCMDCHNRPSHTFSATAERAVDQMLAVGRISRALPYVRRETVAALKASYDGPLGAATGIEGHLRNFYAKEFPAVAQASGAAIAQAVVVARELYDRNVFPDMNITWGTYQNELGHLDFPGCFRCHDDDHKTADGKTIGQDCDSCHAIEDGDGSSG